MLELRNYQTDIIRRTHQSLHTHKRPLICLPTGSGKTVVFAWLADQTQRKGKTVWFLVHRRELMDQTIDTFDRFGIDRRQIHIGMVATVANHPDKWPKPDLIIFDEAHHSSAATWGRIIAMFPDAYIIGLTATPCRLDGKPLGSVYDDLIIGVTTADLIQSGHLAPYRYFAPAVADLAGLKRKGSDFDRDQAAEILMKRAIYGDVIHHWRQYAYRYQTIIYCSSIKHSQATAEAFRNAGINAVHFDGSTPAEERRLIVQDFRSRRITVLCNVDLIGEGFDVPDCWCCILLRPTTSLALHIQQSGRALRPQPGKTAIILDHVGNYTRHGLVDDPRAWSITERVQSAPEYGEDGKLLVRQCAKCYFTFPTGPATCPNCGALLAATRQELANIKKIRLKEIRQGYRSKADEAVKEKTIQQCKTLTELQAYARAHGLKPGWAWHTAKARGYRV